MTDEKGNRGYNPLFIYLFHLEHVDDIDSNCRLVVVAMLFVFVMCKGYIFYNRKH